MIKHLLQDLKCAISVFTLLKHHFNPGYNLKFYYIPATFSIFLNSLGLLLIQLKRVKVSEEANIKNRYNRVPHLTQDTIRESDKKMKHNIQEGQEASPFPVGDHKAPMNRQESMTNTKHK